MIRQYDKKLSKDMNKDGCAFLSLAYFSEKITLQKWDSILLVALWNKAKSMDVIDKENIIQEWDTLAKMFGLNYDYLGWKEKDFVCNKDQFEICAWYNPRTKFTHFVVGNGKGKVEWDPLEVSVTVREGHLDSKRVFERIQNV